MSFNPNQLLNNPAAMMGHLAGRAPGAQAGASREPVPPPPPFDASIYINAYSRLGMLGIDNVADLGCGAGNFASIMSTRGQLPERYLGIDSSHKMISIAKAAYPEWKFLYGDFNDPRIKAEYERYGAFLMLNLLDFIEDDLGLLASMPLEKPLVFSMPKAPMPDTGSIRWAEDGRVLYDRYSSTVNIRSIGRFRSGGNEWSMVIAARW